MAKTYLSETHRRLHESAVNEIREVVDRLPYISYPQVSCFSYAFYAAFS